jgi:hypothetical protein
MLAADPPDDQERDLGQVVHLMQRPIDLSNRCWAA